MSKGEMRDAIARARAAADEAERWNEARTEARLGDPPTLDTRPKPTPRPEDYGKVSTSRY